MPNRVHALGPHHPCTHAPAGCARQGSHSTQEQHEQCHRSQPQQACGRENCDASKLRRRGACSSSKAIHPEKEMHVVAPSLWGYHIWCGQCTGAEHSRFLVPQLPFPPQVPPWRLVTICASACTIIFASGREQPPQAPCLLQWCKDTNTQRLRPHIHAAQLKPHTLTWEG